jgi:hypothetical protein
MNTPGRLRRLRDRSRTLSMLWRCYRRGTPGTCLGRRPWRRTGGLGVLLGSGSEKLRRRRRAVLPEEPAHVPERDLDLLGVRLPRV